MLLACTMLCMHQLLSVEFDAKLIHHLPPTVAEWHSGEGLKFCVLAESKGMSWPEAHLAFTGEVLSASVGRRGCVIYYSGRSRAGRIYLVENGEGYMLLRMVSDPESGSFQSSRMYRFHYGE
jgi:hypothetical protein